MSQPLSASADTARLAGKGTSARKVLAAARQKFPEGLNLRRIEIHFALADGDAKRAFRLLRELPPRRRSGLGFSAFAKAYAAGVKKRFRSP